MRVGVIGHAAPEGYDSATRTAGITSAAGRGVVEQHGVQGGEGEGVGLRMGSLSNSMEAGGVDETGCTYVVVLGCARTVQRTVVCLPLTLTHRSSARFVIGLEARLGTIAAADEDCSGVVMCR